jgi:hypothetical protein
MPGQALWKHEALYCYRLTNANQEDNSLEPNNHQLAESMY